ncbi:hypothetical protein PAMA_014701 [Pampus argenteus]
MTSKICFLVFYSKVQFYGVIRKAMKPPKTLNGGEITIDLFILYNNVSWYVIYGTTLSCAFFIKPVVHVTAVFRALPLLFPSSTMPPKKLGLSSEALFHVLTTSEDPDGFLRQRPLSCPVVLVSEDNCMIAIGNMPVTTFNTERFNEGLLYLMAYYYALHLTYPKCISTLLSVLQTEILQDSIHEQDLTPSYKKAIGEWKSFIE